MRTLLRGVLAGAAGTLAMDLLWYSRHRRSGGTDSFAEWEVAGDVESWDDAPAPGRMGHKLLALAGHEPPVERAAGITNAMHWGYGTAWAAAYAVLARRRRWWAGPAFGAFVWGSDYVVLPLAGIYEPIWRYDVPALAGDLSAHVVYGVVTDAALRVLARDA